MSSTTALPLYTAVTEALTGVRYYSGDSTSKFLTSLHDAGFEVVARPATNDAPMDHPSGCFVTAYRELMETV